MTVKHVLTRDWQAIGGGIEARLMSTGDQRVDPLGAPIDGPWPLPPEVQATQRFVRGALIETRPAAEPAALYVVITEDRHDNPEVAPFTDDAAAIAYAERQVRADARHPESITV